MSQNNGKWKTLSTSVVHTNPYFHVRHDKVVRPNGTEGIYNFIETVGAVFIVPVDDEQNVYLEELYRYPIQKVSIEIPAGGTDGEDPLKAAKRELHEELGLSADNWKQLGELYPANGILNEANYVFLATGLKELGSHEQEEEGIMRIMKVPYSEVLGMIKRNEIIDTQTVAAIMMAGLELGWSGEPS